MSAIVAASAISAITNHFTRKNKTHLNEPLKSKEKLSENKQKIIDIESQLKGKKLKKKIKSLIDEINQKNN